MNAKTICYKAIEHYGEQSQITMALEEMSELAKEICKLLRNRHDRTTEEAAENLAEEMADVEIMLEQLKLILGNSFAVEFRKEEKLRRLLDRINSEGGTP